jgi:general secretion pathway protein K
VQAVAEQSSGRALRTRGFALLIVLWTLVLLALIAGHLSASGRVEAQIAGNLSANAAAEAARDGGIEAALYNLSDPDPGTRWAADGTAHRLDIGASRVTLRVADEAGRVNPNLATPRLIAALLVVTGTDPDTAQQLGFAVTQWIGTNATGARGDQAAFEYRMAGLDYTPPGEAMQSLGELGRVRGMTPDIVARLRPHLSLFAPGQPDPAAADPTVLAALNLLAQQSPAAGAAAAPPSFLVSGARTLRITAEAEGPASAVSTATAIVKLADPPVQSTVLLSWEDGPAAQ